MFKYINGFEYYSKNKEFKIISVVDKEKNLAKYIIEKYNNDSESNTNKYKYDATLELKVEDIEDAKKKIIQLDNDDFFNTNSVNINDFSQDEEDEVTKIIMKSVSDMMLSAYRRILGEDNFQKISHVATELAVDLIYDNFKDLNENEYENYCNKKIDEIEIKFPKTSDI